MDLLKATFSTQAFYFSYTLDLTTNLQTWYGLNRDLSNADELFWWNKWISTGLREAGCKGWIIPLMRGCKLKKQLPTISYAYSSY